MSHACPICQSPLEPNARYPGYVCEQCFARATTADGRPLAFANAGMSGGYKARHVDDESPYDSHDCWIDGIPCYADEARLGGMVIEVAQ